MSDHLIVRMVASLGVVLASVLLVACGSGLATAKARTSVLRLSFPLGSLSAQGSYVFATPEGHNPQLGGEQPLHGVMWNASNGRVYPLKLPRMCAEPSTAGFAGYSRFAVLCDESCCSGVDQRVVLVRPGGPPVSVMHVKSSLGYPGGRIDGIAGGGFEVVFTRDSVDGRGRTKSQALFRIDGTHAGMVEERKGARIGRPLAVARNRILVEENLGPPRGVRLALPPTSLRVLRVQDALQVASSSDNYGVPAGVPEPPLLFDGRTIYGVDFFVHDLSRSRSDGSYNSPFCTIGPGTTLGGVSGHLVTYTTADAVHVIRMTDCHDATIAAGRGVPVGSVITSSGLFYAVNAQPVGRNNVKVAAIDRIHSTLTFVSMAQVQQAVSQGLKLSGPS